jgi:hypothetical protein
LGISEIGFDRFIGGIGKGAVLRISPIIFRERLISKGAINGSSSAIHFKKEEGKPLIGGMSLPGSDEDG